MAFIHTCSPTTTFKPVTTFNSFLRCSPLPQIPKSFTFNTVQSRARQCPTLCITASQSALIFDCDGVIVESEELHRISYNQCWEQQNLSFQWSYDFYEMLQNSIGGGKEKMRWYFNNYGWPDGQPPQHPPSRQRRDAFIQHLHTEKTKLYKKLIETGQAKIRPGVLRLIDEAHARGIKLAVCSAANAESINLVLNTLVGQERLKKFDLILAGDVVSKKKPDPMIYNMAREQLAVKVEDCVVIEDSQIGLRAAIDANMKVIITHTPYTAKQQFEGAAAIYPCLGDPKTDATDKIVTVDVLFPQHSRVG